MAVRRIEPILAEIIEALDGIAAATAGKTLDDFNSGWLLRHGTERGIEIISEAARHIPEDLAAFAPEIPWKQVRGIGNMGCGDRQPAATTSCCRTYASSPLM
ncbi:HepT-like ribonuclease domain-containing protein [Mesorhizobium sp. M0496]|uniref:HepT-like ribonuclease domain-containing protein n=1 Tax=Mesorhizobium sp. M0496 TaxID=2956952 RepID=UPI00333AEA7E